MIVNHNHIISNYYQHYKQFSENSTKYMANSFELSAISQIYTIKGDKLEIPCKYQGDL